MTRRTKLGALTLVFVAVCLAGGAVVLKTHKPPGLFRVLPPSLSSLVALEPAPSLRMTKLPNLYLWAWERPEDLRFLPQGPQGKVGVAFLANTIDLMPPLAATLPKSTGATDSPFFTSVRIRVRPRLQPLRITPGTPLMAVVRIASVRGAIAGASSSETVLSPTLSPQDLSLFVTEIASAAQINGVTALQIDFDATLSEQTLYRDLLIGVRKKLPPNMPLSITALASWCIGDRWLQQLPPGTIDEAVPMLFRMGSGEREIENYLSKEDGFRVPVCNSSVGVSTDEQFSRNFLTGNHSLNKYNRKLIRIYIFDPKAWDQAQLEVILREVSSWRAN